MTTWLQVGCLWLLVATCAWAVPPKAHAPHSSAKGPGLLPKYFALQHDNDVAFDSDRDYSSGIFLRLGNWGKLRDAATGLTRLWLPRSLHQQTLASFGVSLGQEIYTPLDTLLNDFLPGERPYAGWLYLGVQYRAVTPRWGLRISLRLGLVGRWSFAQDVQQLWHTFLRSFNPNTAKGAGWDYQLPHEATVQLVVDWDYFLLQVRHANTQWMTLTMTTSLALGNVWVHPALRLKLALGWLPRRSHDHQIPTLWTGRPKTKPPTANPKTTPNTPKGKVDVPTATSRNWHVALYAEGFARVVVRNLFLDGSTFVSSHHIERYPFVAGIEFGLDWRVHTFRMRFGVVVQTLDAAYALRAYHDHKYMRLTLAYEAPAL